MKGIRSSIMARSGGAGLISSWNSAARTSCRAVSTTVPLRMPSAKQPPKPSSMLSTTNDDFVDIDSLQGMTFMPTTGNSAAGTAPDTTVLGVTRHAEVDEDAPVSRLRLPMEKEDRFRRPNSRAAYTGEEERAALEEFLSSTAGAGATPGSDDLETTEGPPQSSLSSVPLPYDDEKFAETLLQMEVDGAIDEAWQDSSRKAQLEDVKELSEILRAMKVRDIVCIDVSAKTANFDYIMFGTCEGPRHLHLAAWAAQDADRYGASSKIPRRQTDELWEVVPIGRIVLNLMLEGYRDDMALERKWTVTGNMDPLSAANAPVSEGRQSRAHGLWTLTLNLQDLEDFEVDYCKDMLIQQL